MTVTLQFPGKSHLQNNNEQYTHCSRINVKKPDMTEITGDKMSKLTGTNLL